MRNRKWLTGLGAGTLVLAGLIGMGPVVGSAQEASTPPSAQTESETAGADEQASGPAVVGTPLLQPSIDLTRAQEIALEGRTGAVVTEVDLDGGDGVLTYSIELDNGMEVDVDATTGEVLKTEQGDQNDENGNGESESEDGTEDEASAAAQV